MLYLSLLQTAFSVTGPNSVAFTDGAFVGFFKLLFVLLAFLYFLFSFVVTRQIKVMRSTLITSFSPIITTIGYIHFGLAFLVFLAFVFFL